MCTDNKSFKKQALLCDSTLQRCQSDGKTQLFGSVTNADNLKPGDDSRLRTMITEGSASAALNAVKTCQKVTDTCLMNACLKNPWRCVEGVNMSVISASDFIAGGENAETGVGGFNSTDIENGTTTTATTVRKLLKAQCLETIGSNKYCHMTYLEKTQSDRELADPELM